MTEIELKTEIELNPCIECGNPTAMEVVHETAFGMDMEEVSDGYRFQCQECEARPMGLSDSKEAAAAWWNHCTVSREDLASGAPCSANQRKVSKLQRWEEQVDERGNIVHCKTNGNGFVYDFEVAALEAENAELKRETYAAEQTRDHHRGVMESCAQESEWARTNLVPVALKVGAKFLESDSNLGEVVRRIREAVAHDSSQEEVARLRAALEDLEKVNRRLVARDERMVKALIAAGQEAGGGA